MASRISNASQSNITDSGEQTIFKSGLPNIAGALTISATNYMVYIGRQATPFTSAKVDFAVTTVAVGTQAAEVGIFTSPLPPQRAAQTLTCVAANASLADLTAGTGVFSTTLAYSPGGHESGQHLWVGCRFAFTSTPTQPQLYGLTGDFGEGAILSLTSSGVIAVGTTYAGALIAHSVAWQCPDLRLCLV